MLSVQDITEAESRIRSLARETPVDRSLHLSRLGDADVYLKLEHLQHTGSFKLRGATNKILSLDDEQLRRGVIAASTDNHGMGVCYAARHAGTMATIYLPRDVSEQKLPVSAPIHRAANRSSPSSPRGGPRNRRPSHDCRSRPQSRLCAIARRRARESCSSRRGV